MKSGWDCLYSFNFFWSLINKRFDVRQPRIKHKTIGIMDVSINPVMKQPIKNIPNVIAIYSP